MLCRGHYIPKQPNKSSQLKNSILDETRKMPFLCSQGFTFNGNIKIDPGKVMLQATNAGGFCRGGKLQLCKSNTVILDWKKHAVLLSSFNQWDGKMIEVVKVIMKITTKKLTKNLVLGRRWD